MTSLAGWTIIFEAAWPRCKENINVIASNIDRHSRLIREEVTFEHIRLENQARVKSLEAFRKSDEFQAQQNYQALEVAVGPRFYDDKLDWLRSRMSKDTAKWLAREKALVS